MSEIRQRLNIVINHIANNYKTLFDDYMSTISVSQDKRDRLFLTLSKDTKSLICSNKNICETIICKKISKYLNKYSTIG